MLIRTPMLMVALTLTGAADVRADDKIDYTNQIQPIFAEHCTKCHGADKAQGKLRLNTAAGFQEKLAADPKLIVAGKPEESELYQRITLPDKNPKRMPKMADPLPSEVIELIGNWIKQGALFSTTAGPVPPAGNPVEPGKVAEDPVVPEVAPASKEAIDKLTAAHVQVVPLFGGSSLLQISFSHRDEPAGDAEVALLRGVADQVYALDLAGAAASDAGLAPLADLKNLSALHLELSSLTDEGLAHVSALSSLRYLNLYGTGITDAGLKHLTGLKHLQRLYLWQTKASYDAAMALEKDTPGLMVNLGYNHPVVAKIRLTKEMDVAKKQAEEAKAEVTKIEQQLEAAKKNIEASDAHVAEIAKQLKALEPPADTKEGKPADEAKENPAEKPAEPAPAAENEDKK